MISQEVRVAFVRHARLTLGLDWLAQLAAGNLRHSNLLHKLVVVHVGIVDINSIYRFPITFAATVQIWEAFIRNYSGSADFNPFNSKIRLVSTCGAVFGKRHRLVVDLIRHLAFAAV